jgi:hypothetical protein
MNGEAREIAIQMREHDRKLARFNERLQEAVRSLPDNPRIHRIGASPNCFTISSRNLGNNWSVAHHDFPQQYRMIAAEIAKSQNPISVIRKTITTGTIKRTDQRSVRLHPDVKAHLIELWKEIWRPEGWKSAKAI